MQRVPHHPSPTLARPDITQAALLSQLRDRVLDGADGLAETGGGVGERAGGVLGEQGEDALGGPACRGHGPFYRRFYRRRGCCCPCRLDGLLQSIVDGVEQEADEVRAVAGLVGLAKQAVVVVLAALDDGFDRQVGSVGCQRLRISVWQSRPMRPLPSLKGWMNSFRRGPR